MPPSSWPLLANQQRLWLSAMKTHGKSRDNVAVAIHIDGTFDIDTLRIAIQECIARQDIARAYVTLENGRPRVAIASVPNVILSFADANNTESFQPFADTEFSLLEPPLFRFHLLRGASGAQTLVLVFNRFVADETSLAVFVKAIEHRYHAHCYRAPVLTIPLATLTQLHANETHALQGEAADADRAYWREHFHLADYTLHLGDVAYVPHSSGPGYNMFPLLPPAPDLLSTCAKQLGDEAEDVVLAGFMALLYRATLADQIGVLRSLDMRGPESACTIAPLDAMTLSSVRFDTTTTFRDVLDTLASQRQHDTPHQRLPLEERIRIRETVDGAKTWVTPNIVFGVGRTMPPTIHLGASRCHLVSLRCRHAPGILDLSLLPGTPLRIQWGHAGGLFSTAFLKRFHNQFCLLLEAACQTPEQRLTALPIITDAEKHDIVKIWNQSDVDLPDGLRLTDLFLVHATSTPDKPALYTSSQTVSYGQALERASRIAHGLRAHGAGPGTRVAIALPKGIDQALAVIATSLAGAAYMPLDLAWPQARVDNILEQAEPCCVLTTHTTAERFATWSKNTGGGCLSIDQPGIWNDYPDTPPHPNHTSDDPAYIVFTSGSTGTPKGVVMNHRMVMNSILDVNRRFNVCASDVVFALANLTFDLSTYDIFGLLAVGGAVVFPDTDRLRDPRHWLDLMAQYPVSIWNTVPGFIVMLVEAAEALMTKRHKTPPDHLRLVMLCGDFMPLTLADRTRACFPKAHVHNLGGASECSIWSITYPVTTVRPNWPSIPYGRPLGNQKMYVFDDNFEHCPILFPGHIFIGGKGVGMGYYRNPALTAAHFVLHPKTGERLYRTGDLGRWLPSGYMELLGREDHQIKINGFRIELGEIETALEALPFVERAVATVVTFSGKKRLVAYIVMPDNASLSRQIRHDLKEALAAKLPYYMIPEYYVDIERVPLTNNGKTDRAALPAPHDHDRIAAAEFVPPQTVREMLIVDVIGDILGQTSLSLLDSFTTLGGDSLQSLSVSVAAEERGLYITPEQILQAPTLRDLARKAVFGQSRPISSAVTPGISPMLPVQRYFFTWARNNPHHFNVSELFVCSVPLDRDRLTESLRLLALHHDSLRFRFPCNPLGEREMILFDETEGIPPCVDVTDVSMVAPEALSHIIVQGCLATEATLNIEQGPVLRMHIFDAGPDQPCHVLATCHHLVNDGFSFGVLMTDLQTIYLALNENREPRLPAKTTFYGEFARQLVSYAGKPSTRAHMTYWEKITKDRMRFPVDVVTTASRQSDIHVHRACLLHEDDMTLLSERAGTHLHQTIKHLLYTAMLAAAHDISGQRRLTFHIVSHGRENHIGNVDVARTSGWFVTHTPITLSVPDSINLSAASLADVVQDIARQDAAMPDNGISHGALRHYGTSEEQAILAPLDRVSMLFNYLGPAVAGLHSGPLFSPPTLRITDRPDPVGMTNPADYSLYIFAYVENHRLWVDFCYSSLEYNESTIHTLANSFTHRLHSTVLDLPKHIV
ncbi:non-ribosomal peptide synthetase [Desulfovibrio inopinatus]|uniref:non-ribosomal peptide synthetase n=1 Tax=Desulfovibrio inopinatus TaxID=102109 RepID=UPI0003F72E27|nr:non-ribosomal peptide synthetase [Desulfovibrio inopinatus]